MASPGTGRPLAAVRMTMQICIVVACDQPASPSSTPARSTASRAPNATRHIGVFGASGYAGAELLRLAAIHPDWEVTLATAETQAGGRVGDLYPSLAAAYPDLALTAADPAAADGLDVVFLALPHGASQDLVPELRKRVGLVVDLAADFRLREPDLYPRWYGSEHRCPDLLAEAVTGIPELFPGRAARRHPGGGRRVLPHGRRPGPGPAGPGRPGRRRRGSWWTPPAGYRARAGSPSRTPTSMPWTRTSPPTACSTTGTRRRSSRRSGRGPWSSSPRTWPR